MADWACGVTKLAKLDSLSKSLGMSKDALHRLLRILRVPVVYIGDSDYCRVTQLDAAMFALTELGRPDFAVPGSAYISAGRNKRTEDPAETDITDENFFVRTQDGKLRKLMEEEREVIIEEPQQEQAQTGTPAAPSPDRASVAVGFSAGSLPIQRKEPDGTPADAAGTPG